MRDPRFPDLDPEGVERALVRLNGGIDASERTKTGPAAKTPETPLRALYGTYQGGRHAHYLTVENDLVLGVLAKGLDPLFGILAEAVRSPDAKSELGDVIAAVEDAIRHCTAP